MRPGALLFAALTTLAAGACAGTGSAPTAVAGAPGPAAVASAEPAQLSAGAESVATLLQATLGQGYERRDAALVLGLYVPDATVRTRLYGEITLALFKQVLERDFAGLQDGVAAAVALKAFTVADGVGTATVGFAVTGALADGRPVKRNEIWYFRMREEQGGWRAFKQSYRKDFSVPAGGNDPGLQTDKLKAVPYHGKSH